MSTEEPETTKPTEEPTEEKKPEEEESTAQFEPVVSFHFLNKFYLSILEV